MRTIALLALALSASLPASTSKADHAVPPPPEGGIAFTQQGECTDNETGAKGYCYGGFGTDGTFYLSFWQQGELKFIRRVLEGQKYEVVWIAHGFGEV